MIHDDKYKKIRKVANKISLDEDLINKITESINVIYDKHYDVEDIIINIMNNNYRDKLYFDMIIQSKVQHDLISEYIMLLSSK